MNTFYSKKGFYLTMLAFLLWGLFSSYWYVCGINNFCESGPKKEIVNKQVISEIEENVLVEDDIVEESLPQITKKVIKKTFSCSLYLSSTIRINSKNNSNEVAKLEKFLNEFEKENVVVDGVYSRSDWDAVVRMQNKYSEDDMALGYGSAASDGVVGPKTRLAINELYCLAKSKEKLEAEKSSI